MPVKKLQTQSRITLLLSLVFFFGLLSSTYAAPCYGTKLPQKFKIFMGIQSYSVFKRYLENGNGKLRSQQELLLLSYGLLNWLSIDLKGGSGYIKQHPFRNDELDYPAFLGGGYGFRLKFYEQGNTKMVFGFQHISIHPYTISVEGVKHKAVSDDWQFSLLASYAFSRVTPYIGTRWSRMDYIHWVDSNRKRERSDLTKSVGIIAGVDIPMNERVWITIEGSLLDAEAVAISATMAF